MIGRVESTKVGRNIKVRLKSKYEMTRAQSAQKKKMEDEKVDDMKRKMESWNGDGSCGWAMAGHWRAWLE